jgi:hypothetical protein
MMSFQNSRIFFAILIIGILFTQSCTPNSSAITKETKSTLSTQKTVEPTIETTTTDLATATPTITQLPLPTETPELSIIPFIEQAKPVHGLELNLANIRRGEGMLKADICFPMIDGQDWMLERLTFKYDGNEINDWGGILIEPIIPAVNGQPGRRCDTVYFFLADNISLSKFAITVRSIFAPPREGQACDRMNEIKHYLNEKAPGFMVKCQENDGVSSIEIADKPISMSEDEAQRLLYAAYNNRIDGPWDFVINIK